MFIHNYQSPLYCSAKHTSELDNNQKADINIYFNLFVKTYGKNTLRTNWISAITDEGVFLLSKIIFRISTLAKGEEVRCHFDLLQQTSCFKHNNELIELYS